jgi:hypothetical protein
VKCSAYRYIAFILGLLLLVTAGLKTQAAFADSPLETGFLTNRWGVLAIAEFELFLGAWLLTNFLPWLARGCALASFLCFLGFSIASILAGERSCSCFGNLMVSPWFALMVDVASLSALLAFQPPADTASVTLSSRQRIFMIFIAGLLLAIPNALALTEDARRPLLVSSEQLVDLGVLSRGECRGSTLWLTNEGTTPVEIETVESTCHCLKLEGARRTVSPSETIRTTVVLDLANEPSFTGNLRIKVQGWTRSGALAFSIQVKAKVRNP